MKQRHIKKILKRIGLRSIQGTKTGFRVRTFDRQLPDWMLNLYRTSKFSLNDLDPAHEQPGRHISFGNDNCLSLLKHRWTQSDEATKEKQRNERHSN